MKTKLLFYLILLLGLNANSQITLIPDANFEQALINLGIDTVMDGGVLTADINTLTSLNISGASISDLTGIEDFTSLTTLDCSFNYLTTITPVTALFNLTSLDCNHNYGLNSIGPLFGLFNLTYLNCANCTLTNLDLSGLYNLTTLYCGDNYLTSLNASGLNNLTLLDCSHNHITNLNVSGLTSLQYLFCNYNNLTNLNVTGLTGLIRLDCAENQLTSLNLSGLTNLNTLHCWINQIATLNLTGLVNLAYLDCRYNVLTNLNLVGLTALTLLDCSSNPPLTCIQVANVANAYAMPSWFKDAAAGYYLNCSCTTLIAPNFDPVPSICSGTVLAPLPTTSTNGIIGTWSPTLNNTATTTYTFTPNAGQCASSATLTIAVTSGSAVPVNLQTGLLSQYTFNAGSTNDFSGNNHHLTNTNAVIPAADRNGNTNCAMEFDNLPNSNNQFLSTTNSSFLNGLTEYSVSCWYKAKDPTRGIVDYEILVGRDYIPFSCPDRRGQWSLGLYDCRSAVFGSINSVFENFASPCNEVEVWHHLTATYNQVGNTTKLYKDGVLQNTETGIANCGIGSTVTVLDIGDLFLGKGFTGILDDVYIHNREITAAEVTQLYTLGSSCCAATNPCTAMITPIFTPIGTVCVGDILAPLPTTSDNSITGTWSPALDNTATTNYTFTPDAGQCAIATTMTITVNPAETPIFTPVGPICSGATLAALPTISNNNIIGTWSPALNNTATTTYIFTPNAGQCAVAATMTIAVTAGTIWYADADGDTFGNPSVSITACAQPNNYVANANDCDDTRACVNIGITTVFTPIAPICSGAFLAPLPTTSSNGIVGTWSPAVNNMATTTYTFTPNSGQCATNATMTITVNPLITNVTTVVHNSCSLGSNYMWAVNGITYAASGSYTYTNPSNSCHVEQLNLTILSATTWYADADGDGYGNPAITLSSCTQPVGYSKFNTDCNDANPAVNPCAIEIRTDAIDNNCNGFINETVTSIFPTQCGTTLPASNTFINAITVGGATNYQFKVTNLSTGVVALTVPNTLPKFMLTSLVNFDFDTAYSVQVSVYIGGSWQPYSPPCCTIRTPAPSTQVQFSQCNTAVPTMGTYIFADIVPFALAYKFLVTNLNTNVSQPYFPTGGINKFKMDFFPCSFATFNTTYKVEVAVQKRDGTYLPYGPVCTITTPNFPTTQIQSSQCGFTASSGTQVISAATISTSLGTPTHYRFRITNAALCYSQVYVSTTKNFILNNFTGLQTSTTYNVEVSLEICGVYGPYGAVCTITTPGVFRILPQMENTFVEEFMAVAFPNPFATNFGLSIKTVSKNPIQIKVYDMLGKLLDDKTIQNDEVSSFEIGSAYPTGIYNVIVSQDDNHRSLRVIKR